MGVKVWCVDYTYSGSGTIHVDADSKDEAEALVKKMWENSEIITDDDDIDPDTFEVVDVQPEKKRTYKVKITRTEVYEDYVQALDLTDAIHVACELEKTVSSNDYKKFTNVFADPVNEETK